MHHPFTAPKEEEVHLLDQKEKLGEIKSYQHDLVLNGYEIAGGSIRITNPVLQQKIFKILGHSEKNIQEKFGHLLTAFKYGVPPHGGIAPGIDRILMILQNEPTLREVIAFPTSSTGKTAVMEAPSEVDEIQLKELGIEIKKRNEKVSGNGKTNDKPLKARKTGKKK
jgi:aspartyl-tRNA synthetase